MKSVPNWQPARNVDCDSAEAGAASRRLGQPRGELHRGWWVRGRRPRLDLKPDLEGLQDGGNWTLHTKFGRLDILQHIAGLGEDGGGWKELSRQAITRTFAGNECLFRGYEDLINMKRGTGRPQDEVDIKSLKGARREA